MGLHSRSCSPLPPRQEAGVFLHTHPHYFRPPQPTPLSCPFLGNGQSCRSLFGAPWPDFHFTHVERKLGTQDTARLVVGPGSCSAFFPTLELLGHMVGWVCFPLVIIPAPALGPHKPPFVEVWAHPYSNRGWAPRPVPRWEQVHHHPHPHPHLPAEDLSRSEAQWQKH